MHRFAQISYTFFHKHTRRFNNIKWAIWALNMIYAISTKLALDTKFLQTNDHSHIINTLIYAGYPCSNIHFLVLCLMYITIRHLCILILSFLALRIAFLRREFVIFLIYGPNIDCGCLLESPQWGGSNKHPQSMLVQKIMEIMYVYPCKPTFSYEV